MEDTPFRMRNAKGEPVDRREIDGLLKVNGKVARDDWKKRVREVKLL